MNFFGDSDFEDLEGDEPSYNRARGPTARTPGSGDQAEPDDDSHPSSVAPEALPLCKLQIMKACCASSCWHAVSWWHAMILSMKLQYQNSHL